MSQVNAEDDKDVRRIAYVEDVLKGMNYIDSTAVSSVFGRQGDVTAEDGDYSYSQISGTHNNYAHTADYAPLSYVEDHHDDNQIHRQIEYSTDESEDPPTDGIIIYYE